MPKPTACDFCFYEAHEINYSLRLGGWACLRCHLNEVPHISESHPEPQERQTMPTFDPNAKQPEYQLIDGDYPFEIVKVEDEISKGAKTNGRDVRKLTLEFYSDASFSEKLTTITDKLIDHPSCDWKFSVLARCVGFPIKSGEAFDIDQGWLGFRGWAHCSPEPDKQDASKEWNRVRAYLTDRQPLAANVKPQDEGDDIPF